MYKNRKYDLVIVGGGIIGTFCAYHALRKGKSVLLLEKDVQPYEASFRNFGQAVPSGQALDTWFNYGRKSLKIYKNKVALFLVLDRVSTLVITYLIQPTKSF
jgi:glycine/D-amino acid oxidase-like deaminating enzyme